MKKKYWSKKYLIFRTINMKQNKFRFKKKVDSASSFTADLKIWKTKNFSIRFSPQLCLHNLCFQVILGITCYLYIDYYLMLFILLLFSFRPFYSLILHISKGTLTEIRVIRIFIGYSLLICNLQRYRDTSRRYTWRHTYIQKHSTYTYIHT